MKNLKVLFGCIALLSAIFFSSCKEDLPFQNDDQTSNTELAFNGIVNKALGDANLNEESAGGNDKLVVGNIGSTGADGVSISIPAEMGLDIMFEPVEIPEGGEMSVLAKATQTKSGIRIDKTNDGSTIYAYMGHEKSVTMNAYLDGDLVHSQEFEPNGKSQAIPWLAIGVGLYVLDHVDAHVEWSEKDGWSAGVSWNSKSNDGNSYGGSTPIDVTFQDQEGQFTVDFIEVVTANSSDTTPPRDYSAAITASNIPDFSIIHEILYEVEDDDEVVVPVPAISPWGINFGHVSDMVGIPCEGIMGLCDILTPTPTFPTPPDFQLLPNQALITDGLLSADGSTLSIYAQNEELKYHLLEAVQVNNLFYNPQPFNVPATFVEEVYANTNINYPGELVIDVGEYQVEIEETESGIIIIIIVFIVEKQDGEVVYLEFIF